jgi:hypothetical protein
MPTLHAILVADLEDEGIGCIHDIVNWRKELDTISKKTGMKLNKIEIMGKDWSRKSVMNACTNLKVSSDDAVLFYYSGHGYRFKSMKSQWPAMALQNDEGLALDWAHGTILKKGPRLLLSISDSCNNVIPEGAIPTVRSFRSAQKTDLSVGYKKFFLKSNAKIMASGCIAGQTSLGGPDGGAFTSRFLTYLRKDVALGEGADWKKLLDKSCVPMKTGSHTQSPQYSYNGTSSATVEDFEEYEDGEVEEVEESDEECDGEDWFDDVDFDDADEENWYDDEEPEDDEPEDDEDFEDEEPEDDEDFEDDELEDDEDFEDDELEDDEDFEDDELEDDEDFEDDEPEDQRTNNR